MAASGHAGPNKRLALSENYEPRLTLRRVWTTFLALGVICVLGVLGYMVFEGWSFMDALYMTVITVTTVGYKEVHELDTTGRLWTMALLITGVGTLFYAAVSSVELAVEGAVGGYFQRRRMKAELSKLNGHYIQGKYHGQAVSLQRDGSCCTTSHRGMGRAGYLSKCGRG